MKIVFTTFTYYPNKDGVQMVTQYMAEGLVKLGHEVTVVTHMRENLVREEEYKGVKIVRFIVKSIIKTYYGEKRNFQEFLLSNSDQIDVLITVCANTAFAEWTYPLVDKLNCKKIMYQHGMYDGHLHLKQAHSFIRVAKQLVLTPYWEVYHRLHWKQIMKYDACVHLFENDSSHKYFKEHGFKNNEVILNSCDHELFEPATDTDKTVVKDLGIGDRFFLYVANFCAGKDQMLALENFYQLNEKDIELIFVGSKNNEYLQGLIERKNQLDMEYSTEKKVKFITELPRNKTVSLIRECYACLMTSNNEYLPITLIEAMACNKPFISTNVGVVAKLPGGVIANEGEDVAYWMRYFINHPQFVEDMGKIAGTYVRENMYIEDKIKQLENLIGRVCVAR